MDSTFETGMENTPPLVNWKKVPTLAELKQDYKDALSTQQSHITKVNGWLDNLHVRNAAIVKSTANGSEIVPKLIRKQAEWRYPALSEPFLSTDDLFNVSPVTWEDRQAAQQNQLVLNNQFNTKIDKIGFVDELVRAAVEEGTVILRTGWAFEEEEYEDVVPVVTYVVDPNVAPLHEQLAQMKAQNPGQYESEVPEELKMAHTMAEEQGVPIAPVVTGHERKTLYRTVRNHPTVEVCDIRNVVIDPTCGGDFKKARFVVYSFESSLSELRKDRKYKNLDKVNVAGNSVLGTPDHKVPETGTPEFNFADDARKKIVVYEYWGFRDIDGKGLVKPFVAAWVGDVLIRMEECPYPDKALPFVVIPYLPVRKSIYGEPDGALLEDNQKIIGAVTRGMIDIMGKSANGQTGVRKDALDATNRRRFNKGLDYEFNGNVDPRQAIFMHTYPEIPASAQFMLQLQNMEAESLTGVKAFSQGLSSQALGDVAAGIRGVLDSSSKRELAILRRLAAGVVEVGRKFLAMNAEFLSETEVVRVTNEQFVPVRRDDLAGNFDLRLSISTAEEDDNKAKELSFMLQTMGNNMDPEMSKMILSDIARLRKMPDLAKKIESYQPQPDPLVQQKMQLELMLLQEQIATERARQAQYQATATLSTAKAATEQVTQANIQSDTDQKNLDFVEQESGVTQERELQKHGEQARSQAQLKLLDHQMERENRKFDLVKEYIASKRK